MVYAFFPSYPYFQKELDPRIKFLCDFTKEVDFSRVCASVPRLCPYSLAVKGGWLWGSQKLGDHRYWEQGKQK